MASTETTAERLAHYLACAVQINRQQRLCLIDWKFDWLTVHLTRGRENDATHTMSGCGLQNVERADDVRRKRVVEIRSRAYDRGLGREMINDVSATEDFVERFPFTDIALHKPEPGIVAVLLDVA